jgi:hypothetical protein
MLLLMLLLLVMQWAGQADAHAADREKNHMSQTRC